jgi:3-methyl-2-oxobutanoate hydroxymethyltransferase
MPAPLSKKVTLSDLRAARTAGAKLAMLTCYDYSTARLMQEAGVPMLLVGDSAANVILGHETTIPVPLEFMIELTAAVGAGRRWRSWWRTCRSGRTRRLKRRCRTFAGW